MSFHDIFMLLLPFFPCMSYDVLHPLHVLSLRGSSNFFFDNGLVGKCRPCMVMNGRLPPEATIGM